MPRDYDDLEEIEEIEEIEEELEEVEELDDEDEELFGKGRRGDRGARERDRGGRRGGGGFFTNLMRKIGGEPQRPGEQDVVRSPIVLWLTGGAVVVGLLSLVLSAMISRKSAEGQYKFAQAEMDGGKYAQAIELFNKFLEDYPDHDLSFQAMVNVGECRIEKEISGADPNVGPGLKALEEFAKARRDDPQDSELEDQKPKIRAWAKRITLKAAEKAERTRKQEHLTISKQAEGVLTRTPPDGGYKKELLDKIRDKQVAAQRAILKENTSTGTIANIKSLIETRQPLNALRARRDLVQRYPMLGEDREIKGLLDEIKQAETKLVAVDTTAREAITEDRAMSLPVVNLSRHTTSSSAARSDGSLAFTDAADSIYAIDRVTGIPTWRRVIGLNTPFAPMLQTAAVEAILAFDTNHNELIMIQQSDGKLIWRLPLEENEVAKTPLVHESQIFLPTDQRNLYVIGLGTGRLSAKATFSQEVVAPPEIAPGNDHIVIPGEEEIIYTLKIRPLECVAVSWIGQKAGTIKAPMQKLGNLLLLVENHETEYARLRVLRWNAGKFDVVPAAETRVEGTVLDPTELRGNKLFVASNPQRLSAFTIDDEVDGDPIARIANNQIQDADATRMFLAARPGGELFLAGGSLRKFQLQSNTLVIEQKETAMGIHVRKPVSIGKRFYLTRRPKHGKSVYFTVADSESMDSFWRVILGPKILAFAPQQSGDITAVTDAGGAFRISPDNLAEGGFLTKPSAPEFLPRGLDSAVGGARLSDNRIAVYWGDPEPKIAVLNDRGQLIGQPTLLPAAPETTPVSLDGGVLVVPLPGALKAVNTKRGSRPITDYRAPVQGEPARWKSLTQLDGTQLVGIDTNNRMIRIQLRTEGQPNLAQAQIQEIDSPIDQQPIRHDKYLLVTDAAGGLSVLDYRTLEPLGNTSLPAAATTPAYGVEDRIFVNASGKTHCFSIDNNLTKLATIDSGGSAIAGPPMAVGNGYLVALQNGDLVLTDKDGNEAGERIRLGQNLQSGPTQAGNAVVVVGVSGSIIRIDQLLGGG